MAPFADLLARMRVAAVTERIPADLAREAISALTEAAAHSERVAVRNDLLKRAAEMVDGGLYAAAVALEDEIRRRALLPSTPPKNEFESLVAEALSVDGETPRSRRQLLRIIQQV